MSNPDKSMAAKFGNAKEACEKVSSEAENIKAGFDGATGVADAIGAVFTFGLSRLGKDLQAENKVNETVKNILNIDLSSNDIMEISNTCTQKTDVKQRNIIGVDPLCMQDPIIGPIIAQGFASGTITIKNVSQRNVSEQEQSCVMKSLIDILSKKEADSTNLAALNVLQEAEGLMTKNQNEKDACNVVNKDMSSNDYYKNIQKCNQEALADQENKISVCMGMQDIAQENISSQKTNCLMEAGVIKEEDIKEKSSNLTDTGVKQKAKGITPGAMASSSLSSLCFSSILFIILGVLGYFASTMEQ